jgi:hypothetical protein
LKEHLAVGRLPLDFSDDIHPLNNLAERGKSLSIRVPPAAEVKLRLVPDSDSSQRMTFTILFLAAILAAGIEP